MASTNIGSHKIYNFLLDRINHFENEFNRIYQTHLAALQELGRKENETEKKSAMDDLYKVYKENLIKFLNDFDKEFGAATVSKVRLNILQTKAKELAINPLSYEGIQISKIAAFISGLDALKQMLSGDFSFFLMAVASFKETIESLYCIQTMAQSKAEVLVFSIGSAGADEQQQCPKALKQLPDTTRVDVINLDPLYIERTKMTHLSTDNRAVYQFGGRLRGSITSSNLSPFIDKLKSVATLDQINKQYYIDLFNLFDDILTNTKTKLILIENSSPHLSDLFCRLAIKHANKIGNQLEVIGSYFKNYPVFLYSQELFKDADRKGVLDRILPAWEKWRGKKYDGKGELDISSEEIEACKKEYAKWGILYPKLEDIPIEALFGKFLQRKQTLT